MIRQKEQPPGLWQEMMRLSVIVPTYQRAADLERCLQGLRLQDRVPDEVLVIVRQGDVATEEVLRYWISWSPLKCVHVTLPGQVAALNAGLEAARGDVVAITDDDAVPRPNWTSRIAMHFAMDPQLGGVGGRDFVHEDGKILDGTCTVVGKVQWFGRVIGNHHLAGGFHASVDILKGANMAYRVEAIGLSRFDNCLRGAGAQVCNDMAFSLGIKHRGWRLLYDPAVAVDHYPAPRLGTPARRDVTARVVANTAFNHYWALGTGLSPGPRRFAALLWQCLIGNSGQPGFLRAVVSVLLGKRQSWVVYAAALRARREAETQLEFKRL